MKKLIWKIRYAWHMWKRARLPFWEGLGSAESTLESLCTVEDCPIDAADEEIEEWRNCM